MRRWLHICAFCDGAGKVRLEEQLAIKREGNSTLERLVGYEADSQNASWGIWNNNPIGLLFSRTFNYTINRQPGERVKQSLRKNRYIRNIEYADYHKHSDYYKYTNHYDNSHPAAGFGVFQCGV